LLASTWTIRRIPKPCGGGPPPGGLGLPNVVVEDWPIVADAMALRAEGLDFADALHLRASAAVPA